MPLLFNQITIEKKQTDVKGKMAPVAAIQNWLCPMVLGWCIICGNLVFESLDAYPLLPGEPKRVFWLSAALSHRSKALI